MKTKIALLFWILALVSCQEDTSKKPTTTPKVDKAKVETIVKSLISGAFDDIWADLDSTKIATYHTDDFLLLEHGEVWTNQTIRDYQRGALKNPQQVKRINKFDFIEVKVAEHTAWIAYHNYATFSTQDTVRGKMHWLESATAIETPEGWKLDMLHSTRVQQ